MRSLYRFGSQKDSPTTLTRGFEFQVKRLKKLVGKLNDCMNKLTGLSIFFNSYQQLATYLGTRTETE